MNNVRILNNIGMSKEENEAQERWGGTAAYREHEQ